MCPETRLGRSGHNSNSSPSITTSKSKNTFAKEQEKNLRGEQNENLTTALRRVRIDSGVRPACFCRQYIDFRRVAAPTPAPSDGTRRYINWRRGRDAKQRPGYRLSDGGLAESVAEPAIAVLGSAHR
jgi:hypothetical protein